MWRRAKWIALFLVLAVVVVVAGVLILIQTSTFQQWLLRRVEGIAKTAGYSLTAKRLDVDFWKRRAVLEGLAFDDGTGTRVTIDELFVGVPWDAFKGNIIRIDTLVADGISIEIHASASSASTSQSKIPNIVFDRLAVRNGSLIYSAPGTSIQIPSFQLEATNGRGTLHTGSPITISPDVKVVLPELTVQMSGQGVDFSTSDWRVDHPRLTVTGSTQGHVQWSPSFALNLNYAANPFSYQNWHEIASSGAVSYENGIAKLTDFRVGLGSGTAMGTAEIDNESKSVDMHWDGVNLSPAGFPAVTTGNAQLQWKTSDFSDISGTGSILISSRPYGRAQSNVSIRDGRAKLHAVATGFDAKISADIETGLDQTLSGTFQAIHTKYGDVRVQGSVGGTFKDPRVDARLIANAITYSGVGPLNASANASLRSRTVAVDDVRLQFKNSNAPGGFFRVDLDSQNLTGELSGIQIQLADLASVVDGAATFSARIEGTVRQPMAQITGSSDGLNIQGTHIENVTLTGQLITDEFQLTDLTARSGEGVLNVSGTYNFNTAAITGHTRISNLNVDQVADLSATASLTANLGGTITAPTAEFNGRLGNVVYRGHEHGDIDLDGTIRDNAASVHVQSEKYAATATADVRLNEPYPFTALATANRSRVDYQQYDATANGKVRISGELKPFKAEQITFDDFSVVGQGVDLMASGSFPDGVRLDATASLAQLPVDNFRLSGEGRARAVLSGTLEDPRIEGTLETSNAAVQNSNMTEPAIVEGAIDFTRNEFLIRQLRATYAGAAADVTGQGTLDGKGHFEFRAANIRPERLLDDPSVGGIVGIAGAVDVSRPSLEGIRGSAQFTQLDLMVKGVAFHQVQPIEIAVENQVAEIRSFAVEGLDTRVSVSGNANLRTRVLNLSINGNTDLKLIEAFVTGSHAGGQIRTNIAIRGTPDEATFEGFVNLAGMQLQIPEPPISLTDTNAEIQLRTDRIQIESASGGINGGQFTASGGADIAPAGLGNVAIELNLMGAQTEYPEGFQSEISSRLSLTGARNNLEIAGNVDVLSGAYRRDIDLTREVFSRITAESPQVIAGRASEQNALDQIRLNIMVATPGPVSITNNLANFDMDGFFQLRGTVGNPVITGRAMVAEGGELYFGPQLGSASSTELQQRRDRYVISEGSIDFNNPVRTEPSFNFAATRELQVKDERYIITLRASGTPDNPKTELTSDPYLSEPDIVAMLLTGRTFQELQGSELTVAREQLANYVSGRFGNVFQTAGSAFGLSTVRLEPVALAGDEDLSAKLTIGKNVTQNFGLVYSQNLSGPRAQTWIANYQAIKNLLIRGINRSDDNNLTVELRHDLKWGGGPALPRRVRPNDESVVGEVMIEGSTIPAKDLLKQVTKSGNPFNAYRMNEDVRKLQQFFARRDFLNANIRAERNPHDGKTDVRFLVNEGPTITFAFVGTTVPKSIQEDIRQIWIRGFAEAASLRQSQDRLVRYLRDDGYLQAMVSARDESTSPSSRRFVFDIAKGTSFEDPKWVFKGIDAIELNVTAGTVLSDPKAIKNRIESRLWSEGYLTASSTEPELVIDGSRARFEIAVERGPRYSIGKVTANAELPFSPPDGGVFTSDWLERARQAISRRYLARGFNDVQVSADTHVDDRERVVDVEFKIVEGEQQIVQQIQIEGYTTTGLPYIQRQFAFAEGDPVDYTRVNLTRKKLYDTRLFKRVDLNIVRGDNGYIAQTKLNENPPWNLRYGFAVTNQLQTSDRELGATADFSYSNLWGKDTAGTSLKYTPQMREGRVFVSTPTFLGKDAITTGAVFRTRDLTIPESITDVLGFTVQQQWKLRNLYLLSYDYSYKRNHTFDKNLDPDNPFAFDLTIPIARFNGTLSHDSRDDILNATRGSFFSNSFEIAPPGVGSSIQFFRNYTQYFRFQRVGERLVWASGVRAGVAKGFHGQDLIPTERFRAGGGTTLRAFQQDQLAAPGNALFIMNQELRVPLLWRFSGVAFMDVGNLYASAADFNPFRLRYSPGIGIRIETPLVLVRFDLGFNIFPRAGEPRRRFSFGVGQAF